MKKELEEISLLRKLMDKYPEVVRDIIVAQMRQVREASAQRETKVRDVITRKELPGLLGDVTVTDVTPVTPPSEMGGRKL